VSTPAPANPAAAAAIRASAHNGVEVSCDTATRPAFAPTGIGPAAALELDVGPNSTARKLLEGAAAVVTVVFAMLLAAMLLAAVLDAAVLEAAVLDAAVLDAAVDDAAVVEAALLLGAVTMQPALKIAWPAAFQFKLYVWPR